MLFSQCTEADEQFLLDRDLQIVCVSETHITPYVNNIEISVRGCSGIKKAISVGWGYLQVSKWKL